MKERSRIAIVVVLSSFVGAALLMSSCGDDDDGSNATPVNVTLQEFSVTPDRASVPAGQVAFHVSNVGEDMHEFLVIKTNLAPDNLPTEENGSYEDDGPGTDLLDEIEEVDPGQTKTLNIKLSSGNYVLICNMVHQEGDELEVHYQLGMRTAFTVE